MTKAKDILIYGLIGGDWLGNGVTAKNVAESIDALGDVEQITVRINSVGGSLFEGEAIYNLLRSNPATINIKIDSIAASAGSLIAMAGDTIEMAENAKMMIHNASIFTLGDRHAHEQQRAVLELQDGLIAKVYAARSGKKPSEVVKLMDAETWYTAKDAVANGFADSIATAKKAATAQFDRRFLALFKNAPSDISEFFAPSAEPVNQAGAPDAFQFFANFTPRGVRMDPVNNAGQTPPANPPASGTTVPAPTNAAPPAAPTAIPPAAVPANPVATTPAAPTNAATDAQLAAAREEGRRSEAERCSQINALCTTAGFTDKAAEWCKDPNFSVQNAKDALFTLMANKGRVNNELAGGTSVETPPPKDPVAAYKAEYAASRATFEMSGVSEEDYVLSRQIDNGEAALLPMKLKQPAAA